MAAKYFRKLCGERVYLSPMREEDAAAYAHWLSNMDTTDMLGNSARVLSPENEAEWIRANRDKYQFAIVRAEDDELLGNCGINGLDQVQRCCDVGLFIGEEHLRSKGYGGEALSLLVNYCFGTLNMENVMLKLNANNARALACYEKVGFKRIGCRRNACFANGRQVDEIYMDVIKEEWKYR